MSRRYPAIATGLALFASAGLAVGQAHDHQAEHTTSPERPTVTESAKEHVPPDPPTHAMEDMSYEDMARLMSMDDTAPLGMIVLDRLDVRGGEGETGFAWDAHAWYGNDYDKLWIEAEGERFGGSTRESRTELLWDRIFSRWWSLQVGARLDAGPGPSRGWAAIGVQGLAPQFFRVEASAYVGDEGRTAARLAAEYDLLLTQRWVLQPRLDATAFGQSDPANVIGSGLSEIELGARLRYEIRRELAPYAGVLWSRRFGRTADLARTAGQNADELEWVVGLRLWW